MTEKTEENVYYCCNCTHKTSELYKKYSPTVLKLSECVSSNFTKISSNMFTFYIFFRKIVMK